MTPVLFCDNEYCITPTVIHGYMAAPHIGFVTCDGCKMAIPLLNPEIRELAKEKMK